jgi:two-component system, chemotaxis family, protein-glutamate methylesterase/glutaminase
LNASHRKFDIVALAASAGGLKTICTILSDLPEDFPASIVVVQHLDPSHPSLMAEILARHTTLRVSEARQGERLEWSRVYVARPDRHLLVNPDRTVSLSFTEPVHFVRPSADLLFESVAMACTDRAIAVVLSGTGKDGSNGVQSIDKMNGIVIAQEAAEFPGMPDSAIKTGVVDYVLPLEKIAPALIYLVKGDK